MSVSSSCSVIVQRLPSSYPILLTKVRNRALKLAEIYEALEVFKEFIFKEILLRLHQAVLSSQLVINIRILRQQKCGPAVTYGRSIACDS